MLWARSIGAKFEASMQLDSTGTSETKLSSSYAVPRKEKNRMENRELGAYQLIVIRSHIQMLLFKSAGISSIQNLPHSTPFITDLNFQPFSMDAIFSSINYTAINLQLSPIQTRHLLIDSRASKWLWLTPTRRDLAEASRATAVE
jgi:hypothetical protein